MKQKSIRVNFLMNIILNMSSFIFPLITFPYVSRVLLPIGTGKVSFAISFISYFTMFSQLGIPIYGIRACAKVRDNKEELTRVSHELLFINLIMSGISYLFLACALIFVPRLQEDRILYIIVSLNIVLSAIGMEWIYKALEQYTYITIRSVALKFVSLVAMFMLVHEQSDYIIYGGITVLSSSMSNVLNLINVRKYIDLKPVGNYQIKRHLKPIAIFFAMSCASTVYTNLDTVMVGFIKSDEDVGYYNAAVKIKTVLVSVVTSLGTVLLPRLSYYIEHNFYEEFKRISQKALNFVLLLATPMMVYFILFAKEGIFFLSGDAYSNSILPMQIIMPTVVLIGITNILGIQMLIPLGKEKIVLYSEIAGAIADLILNIILIPKLASAGAAIGTLVAECVVLIVQYQALKDEVREAFKKIQYWKIIIALGFGTMVSYGVKLLELSNFVTLFVSAILFFGVYGTFLLVTKEPLVNEIFCQVVTGIKKKIRKE